MAAAQGLYAEDVSGTVATDTTYVDICSIAAASFVAGETYLIIANLIGTSTSGANEVRAKLVHGTVPTDFTDGLLLAEVANTNQQSMVFGWMYVYTQPGTTELVKLQLSSSDTSDVRCELGQIFALSLTDVGVEDTDWRYNEVTADYTTTGSMVAQASETFTPNGTDDWLIIGQFAQVPGSTSANYRAELHDSVAGVLTSLDIEGEDTVNEIRGHTLMRVVTPTNASHTFSIRFQHETTAGTVLSSRLFALNLEKFSQHSDTFNAAEATPAASPTFTNIATVSPTPAVTGDWFIWGHYINDNNTLTDSLGTRLQINAAGGGLASNPNYGDDMPANNNSWDATDELPMHIFKMLSLTSGAARDINLDVTRLAGTTIVAEDRQLVAFSLELAGGATQYNQSAGGTLTTAGALVKQDNKVLAGTLTSSGALIKRCNKVLAGTLTSAGALVKRTFSSLSGTLTPAGALLSPKISFASFTGTLTSAGSLVKRAGKVLAGTLTSAGVLSKRTGKVLGGELTSSGDVIGSRVALSSLSGTLNTVGALIKKTNTSSAATLTTAGDLSKRTGKVLSGAFTPLGTLASIKAALVSLSGTLTSAGALRKQAGKELSGNLTSTGALVKSTRKVLAGSFTPSGVLAASKTILVSLSGTLTTLGGLTKKSFKTLAGSLTSSGLLSTLSSSVPPVIGLVGSTLQLVARPIALSVRSVLVTLGIVDSSIVSGSTSSPSKPTGSVTTTSRPSGEVDAD